MALHGFLPPLNQTLTAKPKCRMPPWGPVVTPKGANNPQKTFVSVCFMSHIFASLRVFHNTALTTWALQPVIDEGISKNLRSINQIAGRSRYPVEVIDERSACGTASSRQRALLRALSCNLNGTTPMTHEQTLAYCATCR